MNNRPQTVPEAMSLEQLREALDFQQKINIALINELNVWKRDAIQAQSVVRMLIQLQPNKELKFSAKEFGAYQPPEEDMVVAGYPSEDGSMVIFRLEKSVAKTEPESEPEKEPA